MKNENEYHSDVVLHAIQNTCITYFPFFVATIRSTCVKEFKRSTNAPVENYFGTVKTLLHTMRNVFGPEFISKHADLIVGIINKISTMMLTTPKAIRRRKTKNSEGPTPNPDIEYEVHSQETWNKKSRKSKSFYFPQKVAFHQAQK